MKETFNEFEIPYSHVAPGYSFNPDADTHIASLMSLKSKLSYLNPNVVFIDETHFGAATLDRVVDYYTKQGCWIIGLSATPVKLSGQGLDCWYDDMVEGESMRWLIDNKWLSDYRGFAPSHVDLSGVKTVAGDYAKGELSELMEQDRVLVGNAVKHYREHATDKLGITYCVSVKHSEIVAEEFRNQGVSAMSISGKTPEDERRRIIRAFANREIKILTNCDLLTFGFDLASNAGVDDVTVECMSDLRPTKSLALQCQKWGRVLRRKDYPALIFDHANNFRTHGMPCDDREWTLESKEKKERQVLQPAKECPECYRVHKPAPHCPECGHVYVAEERSIKEIEGELKEIKRIEREKKKERTANKRAYNRALPPEKKKKTREAVRKSLLAKGKSPQQIYYIIKGMGLA
jgi:superfamily II DNA or RNA helicase